MTFYEKANNKILFYLKKIGRSLFKHSLSNVPFCVISNDCFGGEIYRVTNRRYNTPFIGLMLMGPCFIKLLSALDYYLSLEPIFAQVSKYEERNLARAGNNCYPIGILDDIEIHFMHFNSEKDAREKWTRRKERLVHSNLAVIFSVGKDYAGPSEIQAFEKMKFNKKLLLSPDNLKSIENFVQIPNMEKDATKAFRQSLRLVNYRYWLKTGKHQNNWLKRFVAGIFYKSFID